MKTFITVVAVSLGVHAGLLAAVTMTRVFPGDESPASHERTFLSPRRPERVTVMTGPSFEARFETPEFVELPFRRALEPVPLPPGLAGNAKTTYLAEDPEFLASRAFLDGADIVVRTYASGWIHQGPLTARPYGCGVEGDGYFRRTRVKSVITGCESHHGSCKTIVAALDWLARHQNPDGSWSVTDYAGNCSEPCMPAPGEAQYQTGVTALALYAFLQAGYTPFSQDTPDGRRFAHVIRRSLQWLLDRQDEDGCFADRNTDKYMYGHAITTLALSQAQSLTGTALLKNSVQKAVDFLVAAQNPGKGWRYSVRSGDNDTSVTGWAFLALKAAENAGYFVPESAFEGARRWFDEVTESAYGRTGYSFRGGTRCGMFLPGKDDFVPHETMTAMAIACRILKTGSTNFGNVPNGNALLYRDLPDWNEKSIDFMYWFCGTLTVFQ